MSGVTQVQLTVSDQEADEMAPVTDEPGELAALRDAFPRYRFRRRDIRGVPCYLAEARGTDTPLAVARSDRGAGERNAQCRRAGTGVFGVMRIGGELQRRRELH